MASPPLGALETFCGRPTSGLRRRCRAGSTRLRSWGALSGGRGRGGLGGRAQRDPPPRSGVSNGAAPPRGGGEGRRCPPTSAPDPHSDLDSGSRTPSLLLFGCQLRAPHSLPAAIRAWTPVSKPQPQPQEPDPAYPAKLTWNAVWAVGQRGPRPQAGVPRSLSASGAASPRQGTGRVPRSRNSSRCGGGPLPPGLSSQPAGQPSPPLVWPVRKAGLAGDRALHPAPFNREFFHWLRDQRGPATGAYWTDVQRR